LLPLRDVARAARGVPLRRVPDGRSDALGRFAASLEMRPSAAATASASASAAAASAATVSSAATATVAVTVAAAAALERSAGVLAGVSCRVRASTAPMCLGKREMNFRVSARLVGVPVEAVGGRSSLVPERKRGEKLGIDLSGAVEVVPGPRE
jgi:hypothetical protein